MQRAIPISVVSLMLMLGLPLTAQEPDRLGDARKLYESAEYARALSTLDGIQPGAITVEQARDRLVYQALCLLALEQQSTLDAKIEELVRTDPFFSPGSDVPPRLRELVDGARKRMRPSLVEAHYRTGKERFDAGDHSAAVREFTRAIQLAESTPPEENGDGTLADITLLARGFRDLAQRALDAPAPSTPLNPDDVVPPVVIQQEIPAWPPSLASHVGNLQGEGLTGILQVVVTKSGAVGTITLVKRIHPVYDALLVAAAREWKYQPATLKGEPIEFVKRLNVKISAR